jgi:hypothetical protein
LALLGTFFSFSSSLKASMASRLSLKTICCGFGAAFDCFDASLAAPVGKAANHWVN